MALRKIINVEGEGYINTDSGVISIGPQKSAFNAYCKVAQITANKAEGRVVVQSTADGYNANKQYTVPLSVEDGAPNFIKQAYLHLKTLPDFKDATDC